MQFNAFEPKHRNACLAICRSNIPKYVLPHEEADFLDFLARHQQYDCRYIVLEHAGRVIAWGGLYLQSDKQQETMCWGLVHRKWHLRGLGRYMVLYRLSWLRQHPEIDLVKMDTTQHTFQFFEKLGFEVQKVERNHYGSGLHRYDLTLLVNEDVRVELDKALAAARDSLRL